VTSILLHGGSQKPFGHSLGLKAEEEHNSKMALEVKALESGCD
jgi:hypothetical protein